MQSNQSTPKNSDEIDVTQFFKWVEALFVGAGRTILYGLAGFRNLFFTNRLFFAGIIIIGLAFGALYSELIKKKYYKSTLVLSCDYLSPQILNNTIQKFNLLCKEDDRAGLTGVLGIDPEVAKNIQGFEFRPFVSEDDIVEMELLKEQLNNLASDKKDVVEKVLDQLTIVNRNTYQISVIVYDPNVVKPLEQAVISYFSKNEFIKRRMEINRLNLTSRKKKLEHESRQLDSLKVVLFENFQSLGKTSRGSGNVILGDERLANPLDVFKEDLALHTQLLDIEHRLFVRPDFELIDGFTTFKEPESASLVKILFISFWISLAMGYLIIGAWKFDRLLASYSTK